MLISPFMTTMIKHVIKQPFSWHDTAWSSSVSLLVNYQKLQQVSHTWKKNLRHLYNLLYYMLGKLSTADQFDRNCATFTLMFNTHVTISHDWPIASEICGSFVPTNISYLESWRNFKNISFFDQLIDKFHNMTPTWCILLFSPMELISFLCLID